MASAALATVSSAALFPPGIQSGPSQQNHRNRASFSAAPTPASLPPSSTTNNPPTPSYPTAMMRPSSQPQPPPHHPSQPSSQQSFAMSQNQPTSSSQQQALGANSFRAALNSSSFRDSAEPPHASQSFRDDAAVPQIYSAVYSGTNVYEMEVNGIAVMRRRHDSWLNATQILKVAGVDKGKRTKILEKEIQIGEHEKIQGGYGKYQGTWIKFERAVEVCRQYHVEDLLRPLLIYDMGQDGGVAGQGNLNTPTKEQAMAAQRKRMYNPSQESRMEGGAGTFFKGISSTASNMVGIISKARFDSPAPRNRGGVHGKNGLTRAPSFNRQPSMQSIDDLPPTNSQQSFVSDHQGNDSAFSTQQTNGDNTEPPRKRQRIAMTPADSFGAYTSAGMEMMANTFPGSPTEPNESFLYSQHGIDANSSINDGAVHGPLPPLPYEASVDAEGKRNMLMSLFMDTNASDPAKHEILRSMTPAELDMPIDAQSHTALHWAATLSRMPLLRTLVRAGASPFRVNAVGETALMRACLVTNSHEHNSMPDLLDVLGSTIEARDTKGRTVLHHIAVTSSVKGRSAASRYYLQSLLEWVVRQGSSSQDSQANGATANPAKLGLARFMSEIVNAQDKAGDTALNIAAKIGNRSIVSQLIEVCADPNLANRQGLRPLDFGVGMELAKDGGNGDGAKEGEASCVVGSSQKSRESNDDIVTSITHLLTETSSAFQTDMRAKQHSIDALHASLRTASSQLAEARKSLESLQDKARSETLSRQTAVNLSRALQDEQYRLAHLKEKHGEVNMSGAVQWESEIEEIANGARPAELPKAALLRARIEAMRAQTEATRRSEVALKGQSRSVELKYRHLVALAAKCGDADVDTHLDSLMRAVESEKGELEVGRVRRFLGGVDGLAH